MEEKNPPAKIDWAARRKRRKLAWGDLPAFLDASASVSASIFGARRLPELKSMYLEQQREANTNATADPPEECFQSSGGKTSARHLRRRTTSLHRRIRHRFPTGRSKPKESLTREDASEIATISSTTTEKVKSTTRRARRNNRSTLCSEHFGWQGTTTIEEHTNKDTSSTRNINTSIHYWMTTHLWHTKRFHIESLWGWKVPLVHNNRGGRASLRLSQEQSKAWVQDVSWRTQPIDVYSSSFPGLLQALSRIGPNIAQSKAVLSGSQLGQGVLHHVDQFPKGAIGPASWRIFSQTNAAGSNTEWTCQLWVHPSIRPTLLECLKTLSSSSKEYADLTIVSQVAGGRSCLQLRGVNATETLRKVLAPQVKTPLHPWDWNWNTLHDATSGAEMLPHGAIFSVQVDLSSHASTAAASAAALSNSNSEAATKHVESVRQSISDWDPSRQPEHERYSTDNHDILTRDNTVLLVFQKPREPDHCAANQAICGWDIICTPELAKDLWNRLVVNSNEVVFPIGIVEEAQLLLECQPPVPLFPRDYVDTKESKKYWSGVDPDWKRVRQLWQGGWGRLPVDKEPTALRPISFQDLVVPEATATKDDADEAKPDAESDSVVVVRGTFGQPFCNAIAGCAKMAPARDPDDDSSKAPTRRKRRRTRHPTQLVSAMPLSNDQAHEFTESCRLLQTSLTLPAVLSCHVRVSGPGTILPGARLLLGSNDDDKSLLGIVTAGGFSPARGGCHGVGIVGAARLLEVLASVGGEMQKRGAVIVRNLNGTSEIQLLIKIKDGTAEYSGTLSLLTEE